MNGSACRSAAETRYSPRNPESPAWYRRAGSTLPNRIPGAPAEMAQRPLGGSRAETEARRETPSAQTDGCLAGEGL
eukprot:4558685-Lingulodinium_polyedra.AAC.1